MRTTSDYDIVSLLEGMIPNMRPTVEVTNTVDNGNGTYTLTVCNSSYLRTGSIFVYDGVTYKVVSIVNNNTVVIEGSKGIYGSFPLRSPYFITDTPQGANNELNIKSSDLDRHPFIWLLENFPTDYTSDNSGVVGTARVRLFFLDVSKNEEWLNKDHRSECIKPMRNLIDTFLTNVQRNISGKFSKNATTYTVIDRVRFGVYSSDRGNTQGIMDESLSGVELDITIPIRDYSVDCCKCLPINEIISNGLDYELDFLVN